MNNDFVNKVASHVGDIASEHNIKEADSVSITFTEDYAIVRFKNASPFDLAGAAMNMFGGGGGGMNPLSMLGGMFGGGSSDPSKQQPGPVGQGASTDPQKKKENLQNAEGQAKGWMNEIKGKVISVIDPTKSKEEKNAIAVSGNGLLESIFNQVKTNPIFALVLPMLAKLTGDSSLLSSGVKPPDQKGTTTPDKNAPQGSKPTDQSKQPVPSSAAKPTTQPTIPVDATKAVVPQGEIPPELDAQIKQIPGATPAGT